MNAHINVNRPLRIKEMASNQKIYVMDDNATVIPRFFMSHTQRFLCRHLPLRTEISTSFANNLLIVIKEKLIRFLSNVINKAFKRSQIKVAVMFFTKIFLLLASVLCGKKSNLTKSGLDSVQLCIPIPTQNILIRDLACVDVYVNIS